MSTLLRINLCLVVALAVGLGIAKIVGLAPQHALYQTIGLSGASLASFGVVQVGAGVLIASMPTRRIGAGIFMGSMVVTMLAFHHTQAPLQALAALAVLAMPGLVLSATPKSEGAPLVTGPRLPRRA